MRKITVIIILVLQACATKIPVQQVKVDRTYDQNPHEAFGKKFAIATQGAAATQAAKKIFDQGGNIFDAAVAASFAIAVERPQSTGIAGGGFMLLYNAKEKKTYAIDFRELAPLKASEKMFQDASGNVIPDRSTTGIFSSAVPTMVAGMVSIHQKFGKLPWEKLLEPAIELAENGFEIYPHLATALTEQSKILGQSNYAKSIFFNADGTPKKLGEPLIQKDLAKTLREIQSKGAKGFYDGWVRDAILETSRKHQGLLTKEDFEQDFVKYREPVKGVFANFDVVSMPPPSSGGTHVIEILNILDPIDIWKFHDPMNPTAVHYVSAAMQAAYADRFKYMGDPDFNQIPIPMLISLNHAKEIRKKFWFKKVAIPSKSYADSTVVQPAESTQTTHFSMMDGESNVISTTQTVNGWFGSGIVVDGTGMVLNNEMDDFTSKVGVANQFGLIGGKANAIEPKKRPLSSMSPTIVFDWKKRPVLALGTPSGSKIINCVTQVILNYIEFKMPLKDAVSSMRYHHQWYPEEIAVEAPGFPAETQKQLESMGYKIVQKDLGCKVEAVSREGTTLHAVSDTRGEGMSLGN